MTYTTPIIPRALCFYSFLPVFAPRKQSLMAGLAVGTMGRDGGPYFAITPPTVESKVFSDWVVAAASVPVLYIKLLYNSSSSCFKSHNFHQTCYFSRCWHWWGQYSVQTLFQKAKWGEVGRGCSDGWGEGRGGACKREGERTLLDRSRLASCLFILVIHSIT